MKCDVIRVRAGIQLDTANNIRIPEVRQGAVVAINESPKFPIFRALGLSSANDELMKEYVGAMLYKEPVDGIGKFPLKPTKGISVLDATTPGVSFV